MQKKSSKDEQLLRASELFDGQCHHMSQEDFDLLASDDVSTHLRHWSLIGSALRHELPSKIDPDFSRKVMARIAEIDKDQAQQEDDLPSMLSSKAAFRAGLGSYVRNKPQDQDVEVSNDDFAVGPYETTAVGPYEDSYVGAYDNKAVGAYDHKAVGAYDRPVANDTSDQLEDQPTTVAMPKQTVRKAGLFSLKRAYTFATQVAIAASVAIVAVVGLQTYNASFVSSSSPASTFATNDTAIGGLSLASYPNNNSDVLTQLNSQFPKQADNNVDNTKQANGKSLQEVEIERINLYVQGYVFDTAAHN